MNYIALINAFWRYHDEHHFNKNEITLYFYLLKWCNHLLWKNPFDRNNALVSADIDISKPTLHAARVRLKSVGLINFKTNNGNANVKYWIVDTEPERNFPAKLAGSNIAAVLGSSTSPVGGIPLLNINTNQTKQNQTLYREIAHLSISSVEFDNLVKLGYDKAAVDGILDDIENYKDNSKYRSLFLTAKIWLAKNAKKQGSDTVPDSLSKKEEKKLQEKALAGFAIYKSRGSYTDWDNMVYNYLFKKQLIMFDGTHPRLKELLALETQGKLSEAKQLALMVFFYDLAEVGQELKDLLKN